MLDMFRSYDPKTLRPHQERAIALVRQSLANGNKRVVCQGPTGFGKTLVASKIIEGALAKGNRVIFTAPAVSLIDQTVKSFADQGIYDVGVMQADHPLTNPSARVQVATVQTLAKRSIPAASLVIVDECHQRSEVMEKLMDERQDVFYIGLSATPWAKGMGLRWQDLVIPTTIGELIEGGYLSRFVAYAPDVPDLRGVKVQAGEFVEEQLAQLMGEAKLVASVVGTWLEKGEHRPTLCFAVNRAHAAQIQAEFVRQGIAAGYCDANTKRPEFDELAEQFKAGEIKVVCSVRKITTGVDWPVSCIIDAAPTRSEMLHVQKIGRGLRVNPGTEDLVILDHAGNSLRLGLVTDIMHGSLDVSKPNEKQAAKPKAEKLPKECSKCGTLHIGAICPSCGHERKPVSGVETADGELIEMTGKVRKPTSEDKQRFWSMALWLDAERGRQGKLAKGLYKGKFGVWPKGLDYVKVRPDHAFWNYEKSRRIAFAKRMDAAKGGAA